MNRSHYLARDGKIFGPIDDAAFEGLRVSGEIRTYSWIWDWSLATWAPIDPPPPPLTTSTEAGAHERAPRPAAQKRSVAQPNRSHWLAACHDFQGMVAGTLEQVHELGCELRAQGDIEEPTFGTSGPVILNLFDPKSGRSINVRAQILGVARDQRGFHYRLGWDKKPAL